MSCIIYLITSYMTSFVPSVLYYIIKAAMHTTEFFLPPFKKTQLTRRDLQFADISYWMGKKDNKCSGIVSGCMHLMALWITVNAGNNYACLFLDVRLKIIDRWCFAMNMASLTSTPLKMWWTNPLHSHEYYFFNPASYSRWFAKKNSLSTHLVDTKYILNEETGLACTNIWSCSKFL